MKWSFWVHFSPVCIAPYYSATVAIKQELKAQWHWQQKENCTDFPQFLSILGVRWLNLTKSSKKNLFDYIESNLSRCHCTVTQVASFVNFSPKSVIHIWVPVVGSLESSLVIHKPQVMYMCWKNYFFTISTQSQISVPKTKKTGFSFPYLFILISGSIYATKREPKSVPVM